MEEEKEQPIDDEFISQDVLPVEEEYLQVSQEAAVRSVELPTNEKGEVTGPKSLSEAMDDATDLTDMQFAAARLFPKAVGIDDVMIGRIAPDAFLALLHIMVTDKIMTSDPSKSIVVNQEIIKAYTKLTIGLDGRGRMDFAELLGAAKEVRQQENLLKGI
jgi:hypothetical protein